MNNPTFNLSRVNRVLLPMLASTVLLGCNESNTNPDNNTQGPVTPQQLVKVYYQATTAQRSGDSSPYSKASLYVWNNEQCAAYAGNHPDANDWAKGLLPTGIDDELGAYWELPYHANEPTQCINFIPRIDGQKPLGDYDAKVDLTQLGAGNAVYTQQGVAAVYPELIPRNALPANTARLYLNTQDGDESFFTLHVWNEGECQNYAASNSAWPGIAPSGYSKTYGPYWDLPINGRDNCINVIPNNKTNGDYQTANLKLDFTKTGAIGPIGFVFKGTDKIYYQPLAKRPQNQVELSGASAIFADASTLLVGNLEATSATLYYSRQGQLRFDSASKTVLNADHTITSERPSGTEWQAQKPHLTSGFRGFEFDFQAAGLDLKALLQGQLLLVASDATGVLLATEVQPASALDALYADSASTLQYGALINPDGSTTFRLWAPTAQAVSLIPYGTDKQAKTPIAMSFDAQSGSWSAVNTALAHGDYYRYQITVYHPATDQIETYQVTDPYSHSLAINSLYSQVVDLNHADLKPEGWDTLAAPHPQNERADFILYEAHVRDFSAHDTTVTSAHRGKFAAFSEQESQPVQHLKQLARSGVTHLHLLPVFDIATINEDPEQVVNLDQPFSRLCDLKPALKNDSDLAAYCTGNDTLQSVFTTLKARDSKEQPLVQRLNGFLRDVDSFNWGYDPFHYTVPEGSYATQPDGVTRIKEFREMVQAVKQEIGMNVVMDVVYNHTNEAGVSDKSVLDRIVPWYYQRLNEWSGQVENSTCCSNTAPENRMFAKLIDDSIRTWVKEYKIDAFRWDLMGHHPLAQIEQTLAAAKQINPDVYFYGEGWNFGEVANDRQFKQATQPNLAGTGIGSFSDRLRDAVRGGGPFDGEASLRANQGWGNGIYVQKNDLSNNTRAQALHLADLTRLGMAGNLKAFTFIDQTGNTIKGSELDYNGQAAGYANDAWEIQNYVSKHDNQTLWDNQQYKIDYALPLRTRVRMQAVSLATAVLGQGVPFVHMGSELLRSKSMQRDSYDSGDWYNRVDFGKTSNNWNVGLPRQDKDGSNWSIIETVIAQAGANAEPQAADIATMNDYFNELVQLRRSSSLLTLGKGSEIIKRVHFHNTGSEQIPGVIVMSIDNQGDLHDASLDAARSGLVVVLNASPTPLTEFAHFDATDYQLHAIQADLGHRSIAYNGAAASVVNQRLSVPAWSVAVFEKRHP
ncbi:pullulanase-type alpha-1,6-glucosidase [Vibrio cholerae]